MITALWNNWFFLAMLTPAIWAVVVIIDVCLVGGDVYKRAMDGAIISAGFSGLPLIVTLPLVEPAQLEFLACLSAIAAGICFFLHTLFFLKALFALNDATSAESINTLSVVLVPIFAYLFFSEILERQHYAAIASAALGAIVLAYGYMKDASPRALLFSLISVLFVSLATIAQAYALSKMPYSTTISVFALSSLLCAILPLTINSPLRTHLGALCRRFGLLFVFAECLQQGAVLASYRATQIAPSVSFVMVAECALPLFIIIFSVIGVEITKRYAQFSQFDALQTALSLQVAGLPVKILAMSMITIGIWLIYI